MPDAWLEAARNSPVYKMAMDWKVAFPLHPEYRTLPMVWYIPPLSPVQSAAETGRIGFDGDIRMFGRCASPSLSGQSVDGRQGTAGVEGLERMLAMRAYMRAKTIDGVIDEKIAAKVGLTGRMIGGHVSCDGHRQL